MLLFQLQEVRDGFLLRFALQFFVVAGYEGGEMLRGVFVVPAAQPCTGGDGFQPFGGGEFFFGYAARVEGCRKSDGACWAWMPVLLIGFAAKTG